ncbi:uncharacterized protein LTR77_003190 [Saxophila tyrrhenica]|uniref:F-box domain-containing protein n=1 Tax=Saxophila tyrrhenica TaxID=1690608 RepID=A0AAV9PIG4_9PEZI|nr:hypothetical protein LTR77_003190 [Saxophila tyrrhenica]
MSATGHENVQDKPTAMPPSDDQEISIITTGSRKASRRDRIIDEDEPLVDTTAKLTLKSKKTDRAKRRVEKKQKKVATSPTPTSLLNLPAELLQEIAGYLQPSDVFQLLQVNRNVYDFIQSNESTIARDIIRRRYFVLSRCFPLPVAFENVESSARPSLLSDRRQDMLQIHKKPYQHVKGIDPLNICTCMSCVFSWNNLNMILDLSYWQKNLNEREPILMIPRGTAPEWNRKLLEANAAIVERAMDSRLVHAAILEKHLKTTVQTIFRTFRGRKTVHPKRLYHLTLVEAEKETDEFLERSGPPSYEFPWHRDNYYGLEAYVPNRKWSKEQERWLYYAEGLHERDLEWVKQRFTPNVTSVPVREHVTEQLPRPDSKIQL